MMEFRKVPDPVCRKAGEIRIRNLKDKAHWGTVMRRHRGYWFVADQDSTNVIKNGNLLAQLRRNMRNQRWVLGYK
jgi:hypothetical protein